MLEIRNLEIEVAFQSLIRDLSFHLQIGDKMAIIGEEGNGKSTLLKAIAGFDIEGYAKVSGQINYQNHTIGYLEQILSNRYYEWRVKDYLFECQDDYYDRINEFYQLLKEFHLSDEILGKRMRVLSGGEKVKVQLLKILLQDPDILLLDEPTNDLDIQTLEWLENFINRSSKPILYVSHDEYLLEHTANKILHLELVNKKTEPRNTVMKIGYKDYIEGRLSKIEHDTQVARKERAEREKQELKLKQIKNKVEYQLRTITRADPHGAQLLKKKMKTVKAQEKRFDKQVLTEIPDVEENIHLFFEPVTIPNRKEILKLDIDELTINGNILSKSIHLTVRGPEHIVIVGENGVGKTTLMRKIVKLLEERKDLKVGYMAQNYDDILDDTLTPIQYLAVTGDQEEISLHRSYLGNIHFTREEMTNPICDLSGGSKAKLILLKMIVDQVEVLLLDEPTRNVSPLSNPVIRKILKDFKGTIISISHDRKYIEEVGEIVYELTKEGLTLKD